MASNGLPPLSEFHVYTDSANTGGRWKKWLSRFANVMVAMDVSSRARQRSLPLHFAGEQVYEIFETLSVTGARQTRHGIIQDWQERRRC